MPLGRGLVLHTLHDERDIHDAGELFAAVPGAKPDAAMVKPATQLIDRQVGRFDPADMEDRYKARLREVIEAKLRGEERAPEPEPDDARGNVIDLMAALKRSLGQDGPKAKRSGAKAAKATTAKPTGTGKTKASARKPAAKAPTRKRA